GAMTTKQPLRRRRARSQGSRLCQEVAALARAFLAEPTVRGLLHADTQRAESKHQLAAYVETIRQFATENGNLSQSIVDLYHVFSTQLRPIHRTRRVVHIARHDQRSHTATLSDNIIFC